jgi:GT2 family glycosyltransferase
MSERALVSVITPTWQRPELLAGAIANVRAQTYRPLEHVIVSDGPDRDTARVASAALDCADVADVLVRYVPLGRNWSTFLPDSFCAAPVVVGMLAASGAYQAWLSDDERMDPDHIESLVDALEASGADFAYGRATLWRAGGSPSSSWEIGADPPREGQITNCLYRAELLRRGLYPFGAGMTSDWATIARWIAAGATWAYVPRATITHRVDH